MRHPTNKTDSRVDSRIARPSVHPRPSSASPWWPMMTACQWLHNTAAADAAPSPARPPAPAHRLHLLRRPTDRTSEYAFTRTQAARTLTRSLAAVEAFRSKLLSLILRWRLRAGQAPTLAAAASIGGGGGAGRRRALIVLPNAGQGRRRRERRRRRLRPSRRFVSERGRGSGRDKPTRRERRRGRRRRKKGRSREKERGAAAAQFLKRNCIISCSSEQRCFPWPQPFLTPLRRVGCRKSVGS